MAVDFVHDQLATGRKIRVLAVVDNFGGFSPVIDPCSTCRSENLIEVLDRTGGRMAMSIGDGVCLQEPGPWAYTHGVGLDLSRPGKPTAPPSSRPSTAA